MKISIIIPIYNKVKYLETLLLQVKEQTFSDYECLLIDDGSSDGSETICDRFSKEDRRFRVFHIPNGGVSNARNVGLDHAQGEYVTFIDADDELHSEFLENLFRCANEDGVPFVIGNIKKVWHSENRSIILPVPYQGIYPLERILPEFAKVQTELGIYGFCTAKLVKRALIEETRFNKNIRLAEDLDFYLQIYPKIDSIYFDQKPYYYYLQAAENSSMLTSDDSIDYFTQLLIQLKILKFLDAKSHLRGENEQIMLRRIYDYVFFCIFHSRIKNICKVSLQMKKLNLPRRNTDERNGFIKKLLLFCFEKNLHIANLLIMCCYRAVRKCIPKFIRG